MAREDKTTRYYQCEECGLHYRDRTMAERCEAWCREHQSCNLEITRLAIEVNSRTRTGT